MIPTVLRRVWAAAFLVACGCSKGAEEQHGEAALLSATRTEASAELVHPGAAGATPTGEQATVERDLPTLVRDFAACPQEPEPRLVALTILRGKLEGTALATSPLYEALFASPLVSLLQQLDQLSAEENAARSAGNGIPEKPTYDPPKYDGAFQVGGVVKQCYSDGIVIRSGSKYYSILGAQCPDLQSVRGYVEPTGDTMTVELGREGREAEVVHFSDAESMADDRRAHREAFQEYQAEYQRSLKEYTAAVKGNAGLVSRLEQLLTAKAKVWRELGPILNAFVGQAKEGKPFSLASNIPASVATSSTQRAVSKPASVQPRAASSAQASPTTGRRACLQQCIAQCGGDANCERGCVSGKCNGR